MKQAVFQMNKAEKQAIPREAAGRGKDRVKRFGLAPLLHEAIEGHLSATDKTLDLNEEGVLQLIDSFEPTPPELIDAALSEGLIRIAQNGDILLLHAVRVKIEWDKTRIRRRLEDSIRKEWTVGDIIRAAAATGVQVD